jgi:hypothetical protein
MNKFARSADPTPAVRRPSLAGLCVAIVLCFGLLALVLSLFAVR